MIVLIYRLPLASVFRGAKQPSKCYDEGALDGTGWEYSNENK
jgi:hypothetical protein